MTDIGRVSNPARASIANWIRISPVAVGFGVLALLTGRSLGGQVWTREAGAHGPLILATGVWLLWRPVSPLRQAHDGPGSAWLAAPALALALALWLFGRIFDFISIEAAGLYAAGVTMLYSAYGMAALRRSWFPLFYLAFAIPPPVWLLDRITAPLKQFVSTVATGGLNALGLPVAREGVTIWVAQYRLLVEDACSGMHSLLGLIAISLLYIYLLRGSNGRYSLILAMFVIPIAIFGNLVRVALLILLTYYFGDGVAQGFLHTASGVLLFCVDLACVFAVDVALAKTLPKGWRPR